MPPPSPRPSANTEVSEELKQEAITHLAITAMEFFRIENPKRYEEAATVYVEQVIEDLCKRFNDEKDSIKDEYKSVDDAFKTVIAMYMDVAVAFDKLCPLEHQVGMMLRSLNAAHHLIDINDDIAKSCQDLQPDERAHLVEILKGLQL